jgi:bifunctional DNA-binding transcriptional regulator/antitoxin component of YhaV-PrlF toxin-antitoxin module
MIAERPVQAEARLRAKNQITLPEPIVRALEAEQDDVLHFEVDPAEPGVIRARLLPREFAGSLTGVYGTADETLRFVREERAAWADE